MLLFMMPTWSAPSELWMARMRDAVADRIGALACYEAPVAAWRGRPVVNLGARRDPASIEAGRAALRGLFEQGIVSCALVHYLPFALRYMDLWQSIDAPLWVHGHGYDLTAGLQRDGRPFHAPGYADDVVRLSRRAVILANSHGSAAKLAAMGVPKERIVVKVLGVPMPPPVERSFEPGRLDCLFLGRLVDFKGPLETLTVFERAAAAGMHGRLTVAGDGPLMEALRSRAAQSPVRDRIDILGVVTTEQGETLRARHHVFLAHSQVGASGQDEALGVAYLEAMAAGLPVVSADGGSLPEIVRHGETGLLTPVGDLGAQARELVALAGDEGRWRRLAAAARADAEARFSLAAERQTLQALLDGAGCR